MILSCSLSAATSVSRRSADSRAVPAPRASSISRRRSSRRRTLPAWRAARKRDGAASGNTSDRRSSAASGSSRRATRSTTSNTTLPPALSASHQSTNSPADPRGAGSHRLTNQTNATEPTSGAIVSTMRNAVATRGRDVQAGDGASRGTDIHPCIGRCRSTLNPHRAPVAQWIERCPPEAEVAGSNPAGRVMSRRNVTCSTGWCCERPRSGQRSRRAPSGSSSGRRSGDGRCRRRSSGALARWRAATWT